MIFSWTMSFVKIIGEVPHSSWWPKKSLFMASLTLFSKSISQHLGLILGLHPANESHGYKVTASHWLGTNLESAMNISDVSSIRRTETYQNKIAMNMLRILPVKCNWKKNFFRLTTILENAPEPGCPLKNPLLTPLNTLWPSDTMWWQRSPYFQLLPSRPWKSPYFWMGKVLIFNRCDKT